MELKQEFDRDDTAQPMRSTNGGREDPIQQDPDEPEWIERVSGQHSDGDSRGRYASGAPGSRLPNHR